MRIVFMGSAEVSGIVLRALSSGTDFQVVGVVTQPDRPCGRRRRLMSCDCKREAELQNLDVITPEKLNTPSVYRQLVDWKPDIIIVVAYGQFLGKRILELPPLGCVNVHLSLLPLLRGAAPVHRAIEAGLDTTGVTIMQMDIGMDSGDILMMKEEPIFFDDTAGTLHDRLSQLGAGLLLEALPKLMKGELTPRKQDDDQATFAPKLSKAEGEIIWERTAVELALQVRAFNPWPACHTWIPVVRQGMLVQERLKLLKTEVVELPPEAAAYRPGTIAELTEAGPIIATGEGGLRLREVQRSGGRAIGGSAFVCGYPLKIGNPLSTI